MLAVITGAYFTYSEYHHVPVVPLQDASTVRLFTSVRTLVLALWVRCGGSLHYLSRKEIGHKLQLACLHHVYFMCLPSLSRVFLGGQRCASQSIFVFCGFSGLPRTPAPLCDHGTPRFERECENDNKQPPQPLQVGQCQVTTCTFFFVYCLLYCLTKITKNKSQT